jgi:hypothetical protein
MSNNRALVAAAQSAFGIDRPRSNPNPNRAVFERMWNEHDAKQHLSYMYVF